MSNKTKYIPKITMTGIRNASIKYIRPEHKVIPEDYYDFYISNDEVPPQARIYTDERRGGSAKYPKYLNTPEALLKLRRYENHAYGAQFGAYEVMPTVIKWDDELESHIPLNEPISKPHINVYPLNIGNQEQIKKKGIKYYKDSLGNYVIKRDNQQNIPYDINTYNIPIKKKQ